MLIGTIGLRFLLAQIDKRVKKCNINYITLNLNFDLG